jgi:superoxide dismutase, Cu-Zn family
LIALRGRSLFAMGLVTGAGAVSALACALAVPAIVLGTTAAALPSVSTQARFATPATYLANPNGTPAITYERATVPVGSWIRVTQSVNKWGGMNVRLRVKGLRANEKYNAEVHVGKCTDNPANAGAHFQNGRSKDSYEANEFWLNFRTDRAGKASVLTQHYWGTAKNQKADSVMIHKHGSREPAACVTVPFKRIWPW